MVAKIPALALVIGIVAGVIVLITVVVLIAFPTPPRMRKQEKVQKIIAVVAELQITFKIFAMVI